jgi:hypothetical protein
MRAALIVSTLLALGCAAPESGTAPQATPSASVAKGAAYWTDVAANAPGLSRFIAQSAEEAKARGLTPVAHLATMWNNGVTLRKHRDDARVEHALRGIYLIEVSMNEPAGGDDTWPLESMICGNYASTFYAVTADGSPAAPVGHAHTKEGPASAQENAAFLERYLERLRTQPLERWDEARAGELCDQGVVPPSDWRER